MQKQIQNTADEVILGLCKQRSTLDQGFRLLLKKYQERLYRQARRMVVEHEDANDVLQNAFIKIYRNIHKFEGKAQLYTWLYRIVTNEAITFLNKQKRKSTDSMDNGTYDWNNQLKAEVQLDGNVIQQRLQQGLAQLPEKQRLVFELRYFEEMSYKQMSSAVGTSVGALKASYHHAVRKLEHFFKETS